MSANDKLAATFHPTFECEGCPEVYTSLRAAWMCEDQHVAEDAAARKGHAPAREIRHGKEWDD